MGSPNHSTTQHAPGRATREEILEHCRRLLAQHVPAFDPAGVFPRDHNLEREAQVLHQEVRRAATLLRRAASRMYRLLRRERVAIAEMIAASEANASPEEAYEEEEDSLSPDDGSFLAALGDLECQLSIPPRIRRPPPVLLLAGKTVAHAKVPRVEVLRLTRSLKRTNGESLSWRDKAAISICLGNLPRAADARTPQETLAAEADRLKTAARARRNRR